MDINRDNWHHDISNLPSKASIMKKVKKKAKKRRKKQKEKTLRTNKHLELPEKGKLYSVKVIADPTRKIEEIKNAYISDIYKLDECPEDIMHQIHNLQQFHIVSPNIKHLLKVQFLSNNDEVFGKSNYCVEDFKVENWTTIFIPKIILGGNNDK